MDDTKRLFSIPTLLVSQLVLVILYLKSEHAFFFWDHIMYYDMVSNWLTMASENTTRGWLFFQESFKNDYNLIFGIPSFLSLAVFGNTRFVFILTNFVCFFIPYELAIAYVLRRGFSLHWRPAIVTSIVALLLVPPAWVPLLQGYPDHGSAAALALAFAFTLDRRRRKLGALKLGLALGFAVLFRRHYAYGALTLLISAAVFDYLLIKTLEKEKQLQRVWAITRFYILCVVSLLGFLVVVAPEFVKKAVSIDYNALYLSYHSSSVFFLAFALSSFGLLLFCATVGGLFETLRNRDDFGRRIISWGLLWLFVWCMGPAQSGPHYILQILPLCAVTGLAALRLYMRDEKQTVIMAVIIFSALVTNSAYALFFGPQKIPSAETPVPGIFATPTPPVVRPDYNNLVKLADYLVQTTQPEDRIMVVGSSPNFNQDLLRVVYADAFKAPLTFLRFLQSPEVDGVQEPPYDAFFSSNIFVVPEPPQYHLKPEGQTVVTAVAQQFPPAQGKAAFYKPDEKVFYLQNDVAVRVWRKAAPLPPKTVADTIGEMGAVIEKSNNKVMSARQDWIAVKAPLRFRTSTVETGAGFAQGLFTRNYNKLALLYSRPLNPGKYSLTADLFSQAPCNNFDLSVITKNGDGSGAKRTGYGSGNSIGRVTLDFSVTEAETFAQVEISARIPNNFEAMCGISLQNALIKEK